MGKYPAPLHPHTYIPSTSTVLSPTTPTTVSEMLRRHDFKNVDEN